MEISFNKKMIVQKLDPMLAKMESHIARIRAFRSLSNTNDNKNDNTMGLLISSELDMIRDEAINTSDDINNSKKE